MNTKYIICAVMVMIAVTQLPRIIPLVTFRKRIKSEFAQSFLSYMPYGVLSAMVFPSILASTGGLLSALCGLIVALIMSWRQFGLLPVSLCAVAAVFLTEQAAALFF